MAQSSRKMRPLPVSLARVALLGVTSAHLCRIAANGADLSATWTGGTGAWTNAAKWTTNPNFPNNSPSSTFDVTIPVGTVTLAQPVTIQQLRLGGTLQPPDLTNGSTITTNAAFTWSNGTLDGNGTIDLNGGWNLSGSPGVLWNHETLNNAGIATWTGNFNTSVLNNGVINNLAGATLDAQTDTTISGGTFNNSGLVVKSATDTMTGSYISSTFNNAPGATVRVDVGTMGLAGGAIEHGTFEAGSGATLSVSASSGSFNFASDCFIGGAGTVNFTQGNSIVAGTYNVAGGGVLSGVTFAHGANIVSLGAANISAATFNTGVSQTIDSAVILTLSGSDDVTLIGAGTIGAGTISGSGKLTLTGSLTCSGFNTETFSGRDLNNAGTFHALAGFQLINAAFNNQAGATLDLNFSTFLNGSNSIIGPQSGAGTSILNNAGLITASGTVAVPFFIPVNNTGTIQISHVELDFTGGFTSTGTLMISTGGRVNFNAGSTVPLNIVTNDGTISGSDPLRINGTLTGGGTINPSVDSAGTIQIGNAPGLLTFNGALSLEPQSHTICAVAATTSAAPGLTHFPSVHLDGSLLLELNEVFGGDYSGGPFTMLASNTLSGAFVNVADGERLETVDGRGSFVVNYGLGSPFGANKLVLSDFLAGPLPEPAGSLVPYCMASLVLRRRRHP